MRPTKVPQRKDVPAARVDLGNNAGVVPPVLVEGRLPRPEAVAQIPVESGSAAAATARLTAKLAAARAAAAACKSAARLRELRREGRSREEAFSIIEAENTPNERTSTDEYRKHR